MVKECLDCEVLIVHENIDEIWRERAQVNLDCCGGAMIYQVRLWHKTVQNLADTDTCQNIRLIQACIYHCYYKISFKGHWLTTIYHSLLLYCFFYATM